MATVLVTGAGGFIGGHVARRLAKLFYVRAMVRTPLAKTVVDLDHPNITLVRGDLQDAGSLVAAVEEVDGVVHCANDMRMKDPVLARDVAVDGTRRLFSAAKSAQVSRFVYLSSMAVYGASGSNLEESQPLKPFGDLYADLKIAAERQLPNLPPFGPVVVILRPPAVYGPGSYHWSVRLVKEARQGRLYLPSGGRFRFPYIYIENLVDGVVRALKAETLGGIYNMADGAMAYADFVKPFAQRAGRQARPIPYPLVWAAAVAGEVRQRLTGRYPLLNLRSLQTIYSLGQGDLSCRRARNELGWSPRIPWDEGIFATDAWLRESGF